MLSENEILVALATIAVYETEGHRFESCRARFKADGSLVLVIPSDPTGPRRYRSLVRDRELRGGV